MPGRIADGASLASELERARGNFHNVLTIVGDDEWTKPTEGTRWTNEQLLFHMMFGYMVVQRLLILVRVLSHLPDWVSRWFARVLNAASRPFDAINFYGTNAAAVVYNRNRMGTKIIRVIDGLRESPICHNAVALRNGTERQNTANERLGSAGFCNDHAQQLGSRTTHRAPSASLRAR